MKRNKQ